MRHCSLKFAQISHYRISIRRKITRWYSFIGRQCVFFSRLDGALKSSLLSAFSTLFRDQVNTVFLLSWSCKKINVMNIFKKICWFYGINILHYIRNSDLFTIVATNISTTSICLYINTLDCSGFDLENHKFQLVRPYFFLCADFLKSKSY